MRSLNAQGKEVAILDRQRRALRRQIARALVAIFLFFHHVLMSFCALNIFERQCNNIIKNARERQPHLHSPQDHRYHKQHQLPWLSNTADRYNYFIFSIVFFNLFMSIETFVDCSGKNKGFFLDIPKTENCSIQNITQTPENWNVSLNVPRVNLNMFLLSDVTKSSSILHPRNFSLDCRS